MTVSNASRIPEFTTACSSAKVSTPVPLSAVARMAACTEAKLSAVTPPIPSRPSSAKVGLFEVPAAASNTDLAASAKAWTSATVFTCWVCLPSITSPRRATIAVPLAPVTPMAEYWAAVGAASPSAWPSAAVRMALNAFTIACTSAVVSAEVPITPALFRALLMEARLSAVTPVTPAVA